MKPEVHEPWVIDGDLDRCPVADTLKSISGKHTPKIINCLAIQPQHFLELTRVFPGISRKVLTERLRELEDAGLVSRSEVGDALSRVRYSLTPRGQGLARILEQIYDWALQAEDGQSEHA
ncbi:winged helix-turn-helix transcriptional regulator [Roseibium sp.]|uniref:winged helix-turn-helix transcriptional regulator n=1 Tax=Roseibium sp. TaxID=1936156 RepID=UPI003A9790CB